MPLPTALAEDAHIVYEVAHNGADVLDMFDPVPVTTDTTSHEPPLFSLYSIDLTQITAASSRVVQPLSPTSSALPAAPSTQDSHKNLAHAALACWRHLQGIRHRCYPRGDLLIELVPAARYGGSDFVEEICDVALGLRGGDPEENIPVWRSMKTLEHMIRNYSSKLWQTTWA